jgi:hypothetical protein
VPTLITPVKRYRTIRSRRPIDPRRFGCLLAT